MPWEGACSRWGHYLQRMFERRMPNREQAPSHHLPLSLPDQRIHRRHAGVGLHLSIMLKLMTEVFQ